MSVAELPAAAVEAKEAGNAHFKAGDHLKAAAAYTKAIKAAPSNHVLYSNRAQAFLMLNKVNKALEDAERCIGLDPTFVKGYHRKASALHAMQREDAAVSCLLGALRKSGGNGAERPSTKDLVRLGVTIKGKEFAAMLTAQRKEDGGIPDIPDDAIPTKVTSDDASTAATAAIAAPLPPAAAAAPAAPTAPAAPAAPAPAADQAARKPLSELDPDEFSIEMVQIALRDWISKGEVPSVCYLQPPCPFKGGPEAPLGQVNIKAAFSSPETLTNCAQFLRQQATQASAQAAAVLVRKSSIGYPCVWKDKPTSEWAFGPKEDGVFMQLEAVDVRHVYFTVLKDGPGGGRTVGDTVPLDPDKFSIFPRIFF